MTDLQEKAMRMALEALETHVPYIYKDRGYPPIQALRQALAQPETSHPEKQDNWVGLTNDEIDEWIPDVHSVVRAIEAKLKEKNT